MKKKEKSEAPVLTAKSRLVSLAPSSLRQTTIADHEQGAWLDPWGPEIHGLARAVQGSETNLVFFFPLPNKRNGR